MFQFEFYLIFPEILINTLQSLFLDACKLKFLLASRFVAFSERMISTNKSSIRLLYILFRNDKRTVLCKNLNTIANDCNVLVENLSKNVVKKNLTFSKLPDDQNWKIPLIYQLIEFFCKRF